MLIITGGGRVGSSLLGKVCEELGYDPGGKWDSTRHCGKEHPQVYQLNMRIENGDVLTKRDVRFIRDLDLAVIKDTRFLRYERAFPVWLKHRNDIRCIVLFRELCSILASYWRIRREGVPTHSQGIANPADFFNRNHAAYFRFMHTLAIHQVPFAVFSYPEFLKQPEAALGALQELGQLDFKMEDGLQVWDRVVDDGMVHVKPDAEAIEYD